MLSILFFPILRVALSIATEEQNSHFVEQKLVTINDQASLEQNTIFSNVGKANEVLIMRSTSGLGSLVNFKKDIGVEDWSVEFKVKNLILQDVEKAGIYLWYLDKPLDKGPYKGGATKFNGFLTGIEFTKERADIAFAFNYGLDFSNKETQTIRLDHISPTLIDGLEEFKLKIIHTTKNFKIELYDSMNMLLSDSFRIKEPLIMSQNVKEKIFAVTTAYDHCPDDIFFELKDFNISSREEKEAYDVGHLHTNYNQYPRSKSDEELRLAVANVDHFLNYLTIALGTKNKNNIIETTVAVKKKLRTLKDLISDIFGSSTSGKKNGSQNATLEKMISDLQLDSQELEKRIDDIKKKLRNGIDGSKRGLPNRLKWVISGIFVLFLLLGIRLVAKRIFKVQKVMKKDNK